MAGEGKTTGMKERTKSLRKITANEMGKFLRFQNVQYKDIFKVNEKLRISLTKDKDKQNIKQTARKAVNDNQGEEKKLDSKREQKKKFSERVSDLESVVNELKFKNIWIKKEVREQSLRRVMKRSKFKKNMERLKNN